MSSLITELSYELFSYILEFTVDSELMNILQTCKQFKKEIEAYLSTKKILDIKNSNSIIPVYIVNSLLKRMNNVVYVDMRFNQEIQYITLKLILETYKKSIFINSVKLTSSKWMIHKTKIPYIFMSNQYNQSCGQTITFIKFYDILYGLNLQYSPLYPIAYNSLCFYFFNLKKKNIGITDLSITELKILLYNIMIKSYTGYVIQKHETDRIFDTTNLD